MLFRLVRAVKRSGSRNRYFVRRIPADVRSGAAGLTLSVPVGDQIRRVTISKRADSIRLSLLTDDPSEVKIRLAAVDAYLENVWHALRERVPVSFNHRRATALADELYRAWADGENSESTVAMLHVGNHKWVRDYSAHVNEDEWGGVLEYWEKIGASGKLGDLEKPLGPIVDRLLLAKGISRDDAATQSTHRISR